MEIIQTIEDFYRQKFNWLPDNLKKEMGHFNVFKLNDCICCSKRGAPYSRKDFYKISLLKGKNLIHFTDQTIQSDSYALLFSAPMIPYNWEPLDDNQSGYFCIFTENFFSDYGSFKDYPMFKPGNNRVYIISDAQLAEVESIFLKMFDDLGSDFIFKYDAVRGLVFNLMHQAIRMQPAEANFFQTSNASTRIASLFSELLERQFPIESPRQRMQLKAPVDFAQKLSVHVNHLNRSLKEVSGKTTSQIISERVSQEARALLKHTNWNISEISYCLGFEELPHFINFFKKNVQLTPKAYRETTASIV